MNAKYHPASSFRYPEHFTHPEEFPHFFLAHIPLWDNYLASLRDKPNVCLEIGALYGGASMYILENFCKKEGSHLHIADLNRNEYITNNIAPYDNVTFHEGMSEDTLRTLSHNGQTKEFLDFIYIDGNHMSKHALEDAVNAFYLLKPGGVMVFDDYGWGQGMPIHQQPTTGIDAFIYAYRAYLEEIYMGYHVMLRRNDYNMTQDERDMNYYEGKKIIKKI
jgi:cephalosporin hydroxylase